jgi:hypothetical protein
MTMSMTRMLPVLAAILTATVACGRTDQQKQAEAATKQVQQGAETMQQGAEQMAAAAQDSSKQMAQGLQQMAKGFQQMAQSAGKSVDYEQLKALLPDGGSWTRSNAKGEQLTMPVAYSRAEAQYTKDPAHIDLEITDTALSQMLLAPVSMFLTSGYSERSDDGFKRAEKISGQPGFEDWSAASKHGEVTAVVNGRFIVHATGEDVDSIDPVRKLVDSVDMSKLAALGAAPRK